MNTNLTLPIRQALIGLGPLLAIFGLVDEATWGHAADQAAKVLGGLGLVVGIGWQWWVSRPAAKVAQVAAMPGVAAVIATDPKLSAAAKAAASAVTQK